MVKHAIRLIRKPAPTVLATFLVACAAFFGLFVSSLAGLYIVRILSKEAYGKMTYFASLFPALLLLLGLGLSAKVIKEVADRKILKDNHEADQRFYTLMGLRLLTALPLPLLGLVAGLISGQFPYILIALAAMFAILSDFLLAILRGYGKQLTSASILILQPVVYLVLLGLGMANSVEGIFLALWLSYICNVMIEGLILASQRGLLPRLPRHFLQKLIFNRPSKAWLKFILLDFYQTIFSTWVLLLLGFLGYYSVVAELSVPLSLVALLSLVNAPILMTMVYPLVVHKDKAAIRTYQITYRLVMVIALTVAAVMAIYPDVIINLLYSSRYLSTVPMLIIQAPLVLTFALESLMTLTQIGLDQYRSATRLQLGRLVLLVLGSLGILVFNDDQSRLGILFSWLYLLVTLIGLWFQSRQLRAMTGVPIHPIQMVLAGLAAISLALIIRLIGTTEGILWLNILKSIISGLLGLGLILFIYFRKDFSQLNLNSTHPLQSALDQPVIVEESVK